MCVLGASCAVCRLKLDVRLRVFQRARRLGMITCFFEYLALESEHNNVRNMRICHQLLEHQAVSPAQLSQADAFSHVSPPPRHQV